MRELLDHIAARFGKRKPFIRVNGFLAQMAKFADGFKSWFTGKAPAITSETARTSLNRYYYTSEKIISRIGFAFTPWHDTVDAACKTFISQHIK
jgi:hypothetical protein